MDLMIDIARAQLISTTTATYPGGIHRATRFITNGEQGYGINLRRTTYGTSRYPPPERQSGNLVHLPGMPPWNTSSSTTAC